MYRAARFISACSGCFVRCNSPDGRPCYCPVPGCTGKDHRPVHAPPGMHPSRAMQGTTVHPTSVPHPLLCCKLQYLVIYGDFWVYTEISRYTQNRYTEISRYTDLDAKMYRKWLDIIFNGNDQAIRFKRKTIRRIKKHNSIFNFAYSYRSGPEMYPPKSPRR